MANKQSLATLTASCPSLEWLRRGAEVTHEAWAPHFDQGALGASLTYLDLSDCSRLDDRALRTANQDP